MDQGRFRLCFKAVLSLQDILAGEKYRVVFWLQSTTAVNLRVKFISADAKRVLAQENLM